MEKYSTITVQKPDTSKYDVNYIESYNFSEEQDNYFYFKKDIDKKANDEYIKDPEDNFLWIGTFKLQANIGDKVFLTVEYDDDDVNIKGFNTFYDALKDFERGWKDKEENDDYSFNIVEKEIPSDLSIKYNSLDQMDKDNYLLRASYDKEGTSGIEVKPEYARDEKVKNLLRSIKGIDKYKL